MWIPQADGIVDTEVDMAQWTRRVRGVLGLGVLWGIGMAGVGGVIELLDNLFPGALPFARAVDMWPQTLAIPGFLGGALFGIVLSVAQRRRRFDELSLPGFAAWGAVGGVFLGALGTLLGAPIAFVGISALVSAGAATGSLALARRSQLRPVQLPATRADAPALFEGDERPPSRT